MNIRKRSFALTLAVACVCSLTACKDDTNTNVYEESSAAETISENLTDAVAENTSVSMADANIDTDLVTEKQTEAQSETTTHAADDPAQWMKAEIVEFYKNAAIKSNPSSVSVRSITLKDISVNNGEFKGVFEFITPIMSKILAKSSTEVNGITGGYTKLNEADVSTAKAYKSGNYTAVEMIMKQQTAGARDGMNDGTVGHAISVVGDIGVVVNQLNDFGLPLKISDEHTSIHYTNPVVKVLIDGNGKIVKGTWSYTVDIRMNKYTVGKKLIDSTSVVMENTITLNGGFSK